MRSYVPCANLIKAFESRNFQLNDEMNASSLTVRKLSKTNHPPRETPRYCSIGGIVVKRVVESWDCYFGSDSREGETFFVAGRIFCVLCFNSPMEDSLSLSLSQSSKLVLNSQDARTQCRERAITRSVSFQQLLRVPSLRRSPHDGKRGEKNERHSSCATSLRVRLPGACEHARHTRAVTRRSARNHDELSAAYQGRPSLGHTSTTHARPVPTY